MPHDLSGLRKAAIVLLSLGQQQAAEVLERLPEAESDRLRGEMLSVGALRGVSLQTRQHVLSEFCSASTPPPVVAAGPFSSFRDTEAQSLLASIHEEHPQTIALVLAHLPADKAGEVLAGLEHHKQLEVVKRIAGIEQTSSAVIEQVESGLRQRLGHLMGGTVRTGGVSAVADILNAADSHVEDQILTDLEAEAPDLADQIRRVQAILEDLLHASDDDIRAVLDQLDHETISLALRGVGEVLKRKVMWNMPAEQAEQIQGEIESVAEVRVREIEAAQQRVAEAVHRLEAAGEIQVSNQRAPGRA
jgi:flagellar motor switch protein FliG